MMEDYFNLGEFMIRLLAASAVFISLSAAASAEESFVERFNKECKAMGEVKYCACVLEKLDEEVYLDSYDGWTDEELSQDPDFNKASEACFHLIAVDG
jgi:hypothetical protein